MRRAGWWGEVVCLCASLWWAGATCFGAQCPAVYGVFLGRELLQSGEFIVPNDSRAAYWECWARGFSSCPLTEAEVSTPQSQTISLPPDAEGAYLTRDFSSEALRDAEFPAGIYRLEVSGTNGFAGTVSIRVSPGGYPATPRFRDDLALFEVAPRCDCLLQWRSGADAQADDAITILLQDLEGRVVFQTPWPGEPGALTGLSTQTSLPGRVLAPGAMLLLKLTQYRCAATEILPAGNGLSQSGTATTLAHILLVSETGAGNDVTFFRLLDGRLYSQGSELELVALTNGGFALEASAWAAAEDRLTRVRLSAPNGTSLDLLEPEESLEWRTNVVFLGEPQRLVAFPAGDYRWDFEGAANSSQSVLQSRTTGAEPAHLRVINWTALQTNSFTNTVEIEWARHPAASERDGIELVVVDAGGGTVFRFPDLGTGDSPVPGTATGLTIPADLLVDGDGYEARLRYVAVVEEETESLEGAVGQVGRYAETRFPLGSRLAEPMELATSALPEATVGKEYLAQLAASGGRLPLRWSLEGGELPRGLAFDETGLIQGIPYVGGLYAITVGVTDCLGNTLVQAVTLPVGGLLAPLEIRVQELPVVEDGLYYSHDLVSRGGAPPFRWSIVSGQLPPGVELHSEAGLISGIAQQAGHYPVTLRLEDGSGQSQLKSLVVDVPSVDEDPVVRLMDPQCLPDSRFGVRLNAPSGEFLTVAVSADLVEWQTLLATNVPEHGFLEWPRAAGGTAFYRVHRGAPEPVPDPVQVVLVLETNSVIRGRLTPEGLTLALTNSLGHVWRLEIPPDAVLEEAAVEMSLLAGLEGSPCSGGLIGGAYSPRRV